jgi:hypothetical protein
VVPPALSGDKQARTAQLQQVEHVTARPIARVAFTRARLIELVQALEAQREIYDQTQEARNEEMGGGI